MKGVRIKLKKGNNEGSILIIGVTTMALLLFLAMPFLFQLSTENKVTDYIVTDNKVTDKIANYYAALSLAEAGVERAIREMNHGDISSWNGDSKLRTLTISSIQTPEGNVTRDIEIRVEEPGGENPVVKSTGKIIYTDSLGRGKTARIVLKRSSRVVLERSGYNWVCSFPKRQTPAVPVEISSI